MSGVGGVSTTRPWLLRAAGGCGKGEKQLLPQRQYNCFCTQPPQPQPQPPQPVVVGPYMSIFELFYYLITSNYYLATSYKSI